MTLVRFLVYFVIIFICKNSLSAQFKGFQEVPDSLIFKSYQELYNKFYNSINDPDENSIFATAYLKKGYINQDTLNITNGYYMITYNTNEINLVLNDSLLKYSSFLSYVEANSFAWYAYQGKGDYYFRKRNFKKSFDNHIKALNSAKAVKNEELQNISITNLGLLKERIGKNEEALIDFKENYNYELGKLSSLKRKDSISFKPLLGAMCLLANSYRLNKQYDSAQFFNRKIFTYKNKEGTGRFISNALVNSAEVDFIQGNYKVSMDTINNTIPLLIKQANIPNMAVAYYLRGMTKYYIDNNKEASIQDLEKMDSIFSIKNDLQPSLRKGYLFLVEYYKEKEDLSKQLYYVEQLLKFDSIVYDYRLHVTEGIHSDEQKNLLSKQQYLKTEIEKNRNNNRNIVLISFILLATLIFEILRRKRINEKKLKEYQMKFDSIILSKNNIKQSTESSNKTKEIGISQSLVNEILLKLQSFESNLGFLDNNISANKLAKEIGTNPNYLGQIIKYQFEQSFRQYINNLRMEYTLKSLRENRKLLNYSIEAIANDSGYNHAEPFSKAFKTKTGYYPSEFISKIKKENNLSESS